MFMGLGGLGCLSSAVASCVGACACQGAMMASKQVFQRSARLGYCVFFMMAMLAAWVLRDFPPPIQKIPWIHVPEDAEEKYFGQQAVLRISLANFVFFGALALALLGTKFKSDPRDKAIQHGSWVLKLLAWLAVNALVFALPAPLVAAYGKYLAPLGGFGFVIIQMIILVDMAQTWNDAWVEAGAQDSRYLWALLGCTVGCYLGVAALTVGLTVFFVPSDAASPCNLNVALIALTALIVLAISALALHPAARGGSLFPSAVISLYATYLALSALQSEPDPQCNGLYLRKLSAASGSTMVVGVAVAIASVVYAAVRAGSNTDTFTTGRREGDSSDLERELLYDGVRTTPPEGPDEEAAEGEEEGAMAPYMPVAYNYSFFHLVFALASMYIGMLLTGWGGAFEPTGIVDFGYKAMWVKFATQWATAGLYCWILIAPTLFPDRDFS